MRLHTMVAIAVTVCALPALAGEPPVAPAPHAAPARITKVYSVSDIINPADEKQGDQLAKVVTTVVRPYSWQVRDGRGTAEFFEIGCALVVANTPDVLREVGDLLEGFRRLQAASPVALGPDDLLRALCAVPKSVPVAPAPHAAQQSTVVKLRNVAAADAAHALSAFLKPQNRDARVAAEPVSNCVLVSAEPALTKQLLDILAALDKEPTQIVICATVLEVPDKFVEESGLNVGAKPGTTTWTLSAREVHMFTNFIRLAKARGDECDVLSRPQIQVTDNQTGHVRVGQDVPVAVGDGKTQFVATGVTFRATPRVTPDGRVLLRTEFQLTEQAPGTVTVAGQPVPVFNTQSVQMTAELKAGETVAFRVGKALVLVTPTVIAPAK